MTTPRRLDDRLPTTVAVPAVVAVTLLAGAASAGVPLAAALVGGVGSVLAAAFVHTVGL